MEAIESTLESVENYAYLGREIKISPKSNAQINKAGYKKEFFVESVSVLIHIGDSHTAQLVMTRQAWEALKNGAEINVTTHKEFKKRFLK